jgi:predicted RNA binding protein YcfA (HicA-like mRNA interferase family)
MKCNDVLRLLKENGWTVIGQKGSHMKMINEHNPEKGIIIFPNHGSAELGKGLEKKLLKKAGIKK